MIAFLIGIIFADRILADIVRLFDRDRLDDRRSPGVVHTNLIAITYLFAGYDLDRLFDRDHTSDRRLRSRSSP